MYNPCITEPEEREKMLPVNSTPVKLDPGLDSLDRTADLMLREKAPIESTPPRDRYEFKILFLWQLKHFGHI